MAELVQFVDAVENFTDEALRTFDWNALSSKSKTEQAEVLHGFAWKCFQAGWESFREGSAAVNQYLERYTINNDVIAQFDNLIVSRAGLTWVKLQIGDGQAIDFKLKNLANFDQLESLKGAINTLKHDPDVAVIAQHNADINNALELISNVTDKVYWQQVGQSVIEHCKERALRRKARKILEGAGLPLEDVESLIEIPHLDDF